ncbi:MAG: hypothetical protein SGPRY_013534 [Prymnesium sp.]
MHARSHSVAYAQELLEEYEKKNVAVLGVSNDSQEKNAAFARELGLTFPLLCDTSLELSIAYGAAQPSSAAASRAACLVDEAGVVKGFWPKVDARTFPSECLKSL